MSNFIEVDISELKDLASKVPEALGIAYDYTGADLEGNLQENSPVNHGQLQGSWGRDKVGNYSQLIYSSAEYALVVSEGSDPYEIYPDKAQALKFQVNGNTFFAKKVKHPGIEGTGYIPKSIDQTRDRIDEFIERSLKEADIV